MIRIKDVVGLPSLKWHLDHKRTLSENVYRYSSESFIKLFTEARQAYRDGSVHFEGLDLILLETTDIGEYGEFEGKKVPLDLPLQYEHNYQPIVEDITTFGKIYEAVDIENSYTNIKSSRDNSVITFTFTDKHGIGRQLRYFKGGSVKVLWFDKKVDKWTTERIPSKYEDQKVINTFGNILVNIILPKYTHFTFKAQDNIRYRLFRALIYNNLDTEQYILDFDDEDLEIEVVRSADINEAEYQGKDVELNKPKRGGSKKFYVYVRNPKTKKVKKVSFGAKDGGGNLAVKLKDPKRRKAFADRHDCKNKKDKTKPGYWSCRIGRYWKSLGGSRNYAGYW